MGVQLPGGGGEGAGGLPPNDLPSQLPRTLLQDTAPRPLVTDWPWGCLASGDREERQAGLLITARLASPRPPRGFHPTSEKRGMKNAPRDLAQLAPQEALSGTLPPAQGDCQAVLSAPRPPEPSPHRVLPRQAGFLPSPPGPSTSQACRYPEDAQATLSVCGVPHPD